MIDNKFIRVTGAREHNLKNVTVEIPKNKITVITGLSGSGKSSLAFDTIYAEGQRRYMDSLSVYARNFLEQLKKPDVDSITGLSPAIAIDQKTISNSPRSTVGTVTEVYDFLRLLYAKVGTPKCPKHNIPAKGQLPEQIVSSILSLPKKTKISILAPVAVEKKGEFTKEFKKWSKLGFVKAIVDGKTVEISENLKLSKTKRHTIDIVIDRLFSDSKYKLRLSESVNKALSLAGGFAKIEIDDNDTQLFSIHHACPKCGYSFPEIDPLIFSFNSPKGACVDCNGLGTNDIEEYEEELIKPGEKTTRVKQKKWRTVKKSSKDEEELGIEEFSACNSCGGTGLNKAALSVFVGDYNISELSKISISELSTLISGLTFEERNSEVSEQITKELNHRLNYLMTAGAGYLSLNRRARTLSGGEAQRIRLASQVSTPLVGVLYVLDEPSIGLHPSDHKNVLSLLKEIKDRGNTIVIVEHDEETIKVADHVIDIGPGAGHRGGSVLASGTYKDLIKNKNSLTGQYLSGKIKPPNVEYDKTATESFIEIRGARGNNLKDIDVDIPIGKLTAVTGVSGSGKSTLIMDTLLPYTLTKVRKNDFPHAPVSSIAGIDDIERVVSVNQKPIGRTPRSCPATYIGLFPLIRDLFAHLPEAKMRGLKPGYFSFNVKGGRCETCQGAGLIKTTMHFLADSYATCERCQGRRYSSESMIIKYKGKNISDILEMDVEEALEFFKNHKNIYRKLSFMMDVGLSYIHLGQNSKTLSGGEAQRIKLAKELSKQMSTHTLYILDEPTTGLHIHDTYKLIEILRKLAAQNNTVIVIEHHLDLIKHSDYVVDLGPKGGVEGGRLVEACAPKILMKNKSSLTGKFLASMQ